MIKKYRTTQHEKWSSKKIDFYNYSIDKGKYKDFDTKF